MELFTGVVENRQDPLKLGRCQVRVVGLHTHDKSQLKTEDLPWAYPMQPTTSAAMSGIGSSPLGPVEGTWVVLFFRDKDNQLPVIIGTVGGIPQEFGSVDQEESGAVLADDAGVVRSETGIVTDSNGNAVRTGDVGESEELPTTPTYEGARPARDWSTVSSAGINLIKQFEGLRTTAYQDSVGVWTVGYGTTIINGTPVAANQSISESQAESYLSADLTDQFVPGVKSAVRALITQEMFDALCCFAYNVGVGALRRSTLLRELNAGRYLEAAARFNDWNKAGGVVVSGLTRRRAAERSLFLSGGIPTVTGDIAPVEQEQTPIGEDGSSGQTDYGASNTIGFRDPKNKYPLYKNEPDTNRLARHEEIGRTIVFRKEAARDRAVPIANSEETWDQSRIPYNAEYPYNHVHFTESGHVMEFDDTPRSERIHLYHRSGTFTEIDANGTQVNRIVGDGYEILERDGYLHILGSQNVTIEGAQRVKVVNTLDLEVDGATTINIYNDATVNVSGDAKMSVGGEYALRANTIKMEAAGGMDINVGGTLNVDYAQGNFGNGAASSGLEAPEASRTPEMPEINELTVITRGAASAQVYETPEEGNSDAYRAQQLTTGNIPSDELDSGSTVAAAAISPSSTPPLGASCDLIYGMETFNPSLVLSPHFTLGALTKGGERRPVNQFDLTPQDIVCNLKGLCENCLEPIIERYPNMIITSGFRRPGDVRNSSATSQHYLGMAADIVLNGFNRREHYEAIQEIRALVPHDQLLLEYSGSSTVWIHISFKYGGNRQMAFTMRDHRRIGEIGVYSLVT